METKKIGLIALVVVALGALIYSFRTSFGGGGQPRAGLEAGLAIKAANEAAAKAAKEGGGVANSGGTAAGANAPTGAPRPPGGGAPK